MYLPWDPSIDVPVNITQISGDVYLIVDTLQNHHTGLFYHQDTGTSTFELEMMQRFEGTFDYTHVGFETKAVTLPDNFMSPIMIMKSYPTETLFADPSRIRDQYIMEVMGLKQLSGIWSEPLIATAKDIARWGLETLPIRDTINKAIDMTGDMASLALLDLMPEAAPLVAALVDRYGVKDKIKGKVDSAIDTINKWSLSGSHLQMEEPQILKVEANLSNESTRTTVGTVVLPSLSTES